VVYKGKGNVRGLKESFLETGDCSSIFGPAREKEERKRRAFTVDTENSLGKRQKNGNACSTEGGGRLLRCKPSLAWRGGKGGK